MKNSVLKHINSKCTLYSPLCIGLIIHKVGFILLELELWYMKYIFGLWQCDILVSLMKY